MRRELNTSKKTGTEWRYYPEDATNPYSRDALVQSRIRSEGRSQRGMEGINEFLRTADIFDSELERKATRAFIEELGPDRLKGLGFRTHDELLFGGQKADGLYTSADTIVYIARNIVHAKDRQEAYRTVIHEISHHLQRLITPEKYSALNKQYLVEKARNKGAKGMDYSSISEWWARSIEEIESPKFLLRSMDKESRSALIKLKYWKDTLIAGYTRLRARGFRPDTISKVYGSVKKR